MAAAPVLPLRHGAPRPPRLGSGATGGEPMTRAHDAWPVLGYEPELCMTLRLWSQVVGKIRLSKTPWINHSWQVVLYPTVRGLTTAPIHDGGRTLQIDFD